MTKHLDVPARLAMLPRRGLPLHRPARVHWDDHQVPFIEADDDHDLAVTLGVVHVHLRWAQMEIMRYLAQGRMAELLGPLGIRLDRALRTLDLTRAVPAIVDALPAATRGWIDAFVAGINHAVAHLPAVPAEFRIFGLARRPWSVADVVSIGRLAAFDVNWMPWLALLRQWRSDQLEAFWSRLTWASPGFDAGSNSWAIAPARSRTGSAWIASDTHLPALLPNLWLIAGLCSPGYHAVGLMAPGIPAILLGRNRWIAWGGTNLHAASSDLFDVSRLRREDITERRERVRVRFAGTREMVVRDTAYGPLISDLRPLRQIRPCALRWMGHRASDELTAMLAVNRARDWHSFCSALDRIAVPGQNMIYADTNGRVGQAIAVHLPRRPKQTPVLLLPPSAGVAWDQTVGCSDLPSVIDPSDGFVASANNRPPEASTLIGHLFSADHRINRLRQALSQATDWDFASLAALQQDVWLPAALPIRDLLVHALAGSPRGVADALAAWDGRYDAGSAGALAFELLLFHVGAALHGRRRMASYAAVWNARELLFHDLGALPADALAKAVRRAAGPAQHGLRRYRVWGAMHRLEPRHVLARVPMLRRRYRVPSVPADGGSDTLLKTAHAPTDHRHRAGLVSAARHISDLADPDANWFVLLGGQDGWVGSTTSADQIALWRRGEYVQVPLRPETARARFAFHSDLEP